jgi:hypothetical protein
MIHIYECVIAYQFNYGVYLEGMDATGNGHVLNLRILKFKWQDSWDEIIWDQKVKMEMLYELGYFFS